MKKPESGSWAHYLAGAVGQYAESAKAEIERLRAEVERLRVLLAQANDAFDECTGDNTKELVADEPWRQYGGERGQA